MQEIFVENPIDPIHIAFQYNMSSRKIIVQCIDLELLSDIPLGWIAQYVAFVGELLGNFVSFLE